MLYFLENHDEQRIASDHFAGKAEKAIPALIISALLHQNPLMVYAGQEFGERGMEKEGFSGLDGRTTIFDYWCVDTLRRGYFSRDEMTEQEKALEAVYQTVMNIARKEPAVVSGLSYDLMYVNQELGQDQYAFLRAKGKKAMLVAVNFCDYDMPADITIPANAFDYLGLKEGKVEATDLLTDEKISLDLKRNGAVAVTIPACGGVVLKF